MMKVLSIISFLLLGFYASAQPTITSTVDRTVVASGQILKLTIALEGTRNAIQNPTMDGFIIVQGPFESSNFSWVNGKMSSTVSRQYILRAGEPGKYTIGPAKVEANGKVYSSEPITITVTKGSNNNAADGEAPENVKPANRDLFATISLNKRSAYVGEQIIATYTLYNRYPSLELTGNELPPLTGFWSEDVDLGNTSWEPNLRTINGMSYRVAVLKKQVLFPQKSGELTIEPMKLECVVGSGGFFGRRNRKTVYSDRAKITVKPLPTAAPADFTGAVGDLKMTAILDRNEVPANEAVNLKLTFSGRCNLKLLDAPKIDLPSDFEVYEPKIEDRINISGAGMSGARSIDYLIIPRHPGEYDLEELTVSYFDIGRKEFVKLRSGDLNLTVLKGEGEETTVIRPAEKRDVEELASDIRYIRTGDLELRPKRTFLYGSWQYVAGMTAPALAFLVFFFVRRRNQQRAGDVAGSRKRRAKKIAKQHLAAAGKALEGSDRKAFYEELHRALLGYLGDAFNMSSGQLDNRTILHRSIQSGISETDAKSMEDLLNHLQMARYAPASDTPDRTLLDKAMALVETYENTLT